MIKYVLDHGFVRLVSYMQPVPVEAEGVYDNGPHGYTRPIMANPAGWTGDLEIVRNARVSYDADWRAGQNEGSDARLIRSMTNRGHTSPFEAMVFTFEVKAPLFVLRQWHRHRTWSYNEMSLRYAALTEPEFYLPAPDAIGYQHELDKQMRVNKERPDSDSILSIYRMVNGAAAAAYRVLIEQGVPRELARMVLPVSVYTRMFATVDLHNLRHFLQLRMDEHAQYEIREYANALFHLVREVCPVSMDAWHEKTFGAPPPSPSPAQPDLPARPDQAEQHDSALHRVQVGVDAVRDTP